MCEIKTLAIAKPLIPKQNFIECDSVEKANEVDLEIYRLVERISEQNKYIFIKRARL
jgi:hypothetical protein